MVVVVVVPVGGMLGIVGRLLLGRYICLEKVYGRWCIKKPRGGCCRLGGNLAKESCKWCSAFYILSHSHTQPYVRLRTPRTVEGQLAASVNASSTHAAPSPTLVMLQAVCPMIVSCYSCCPPPPRATERRSRIHPSSIISRLQAPELNCAVRLPVRSVRGEWRQSNTQRTPRRVIFILSCPAHPCRLGRLAR